MEPYICYQDHRADMMSCNSLASKASIFSAYIPLSVNSWFLATPGVLRVSMSPVSDAEQETLVLTDLISSSGVQDLVDTSQG